MSHSKLQFEPLVIDGIRLSSAYSGIRKTEKPDVVLMELAKGTKTSAVFTRNMFCAAPVQLAKQHLAKASPEYLLINAGNANAGTGQRGLSAAVSSCESVARHADSLPEAVLPFSTGVIGEYLPAEKIDTVMPKLVNELSAEHWSSAAQAIMTTDTEAKVAAVQLVLSDGTPIKITGMCKGAGMIRPDMATMLAYVATDASIEQPALDALLKYTADRSFNSISVDGDTSTNDACVLMATEKAANQTIRMDTQDYVVFRDALMDVMQSLAKAIVRDGEGATKLLTIQVNNAQSEEECKRLGYAICHSPLVKTALFASDPNWGRILAVIGRAGIAELELSAVNFSLNGVSIVKGGERDTTYTEEQGQKAMAQSDILLEVDLNRGSCSHTLWTCDLGYEYVRINAEYRT